MQDQFAWLNQPPRFLADIVPGLTERLTEQSAADERDADRHAPSWRDPHPDAPTPEKENVERAATLLTVFGRRNEARKLLRDFSREHDAGRFQKPDQRALQILAYVARRGDHAARTGVRARRESRGCRPAGRRSGAKASRSGGGSSDDGPGGEPAPPDAVRRFARGAGVPIEHLRWCDWCSRIAFQIDQWERDRLTADGWRDHICPDCCRRLGL